ncbi:acyl carrier protein [Streptomyces sp. NPDC006552]|uniref:acyl carrier protein n=1 Tax=Streptomyces sp. NPDC006552 TaxID=3157179 RepID=UPI0033A314D0
MSREQLTARSAVPAAHDADVLTEVVRILADVLHIKPEKIDPEHTFRTCGVDSLLSVEYVATVNAHFGTAIKAAALLDHPTPLGFARHMARETAPAGPAPAPMMPMAVPMPMAMPPGAAPRTQAPAAPVTLPAPPVLDVLREEIARILCCDPWDIDTSEPFTALGLDPQLAAEFVSVINLVYRLEERPGALYEHPDLMALAAHISAQLPVGPDPAAVAQHGSEGSVPMEELFDAVRDGRITVDQALGLMPRQD